MGGLLILIALTVATLLWADLTNRYVWIVLGITAGLRRGRLLGRLPQGHQANPKGVPGKIKLAISIVVAAVAAYLIAQASPPPLRYMLALPFLKDVLLPLGIVGFLAFAVAGDGRRLQRRQPDRRPRRPRHRPGDHGRRRCSA